MVREEPWGVVLAGGRGRRLGGRKEFAVLGGKPLLLWAVQALEAVARGVVVVTAPGASLPPLPPGVGRAEDPEPYRGPLMGLAVGLEWVRERGGEWAWVVGGDSPFLDGAVLQALRERVGGNVGRGDPPFDAVVPCIGGRLQPLHGLYRTRCAETARALLACGKASLYALLDIVRVGSVEPPEGEEEKWARSAFSVNTPEDLALARRWVEEHPLS